MAEHALSPADLVWPLFVQEGEGLRTPITTMRGVERLSVDLAVEAAKEAAALGIPAVALFPVTPAHKKSPGGEEALSPDNLACRATRAIKALGLDLGVICDVALDPYTSHGHDGLLVDGYVVNDQTVSVLCEQAVNQARAGCDVIAPSDMMDGRIGAIRDALDGAGMQHVQLLSYAAKYASAFYGPFRDAVGSKGSLGTGDKKTYQMDPRNGREALREVTLDVAEGADMLLVKPGMPYLDIVHRVKEATGLPTLVYQVSGEYAMLRVAADQGCLDFDAALLESLLCMKRAGADAIFTYGAAHVARLLA